MDKMLQVIVIYWIAAECLQYNANIACHSIPMFGFKFELKSLAPLNFGFSFDSHFFLPRCRMVFDRTIVKFIGSDYTKKELKK